jgi:hypothetical protein
MTGTNTATTANNACLKMRNALVLLTYRCAFMHPFYPIRIVVLEQLRQF